MQHPDQRESWPTRQKTSRLKIDWEEVGEDVFYLSIFWLVLSSAISGAAIFLPECISLAFLPFFDENGVTLEAFPVIFIIDLIILLSGYGVYEAYGANHYRDQA